MDRSDHPPTKKVVPKFASFRPKEQVAVQAGKAQVQNAYGESRSRERRQRHHGNADTTNRTANNDGERTSGSGQVEPEPTFIHTVRKHDSIQPFAIDSKGDPDNLKYGSLHRHVIPSYHRAGAGSVIGIRRSEKIDRDDSNEKGIILSKDWYTATGKRERVSFPRLNSSGSKEVRVRLDTSEDSYGRDFISLDRSPPRKRKRSNEDDSHGTSESENDRHLYALTKEGLKRATQPSDLDLVYTSSDLGSVPPDGYGHPPEDDLRWQSIEISQHLKEKPSDFMAWLRLIELQDELIGLGRGSAASKLTTAERQSNADVKISIYDKALYQVKDPRSRETLMLGMMEEGARIWDAEKLSRKWQTMLQDNPTYFSLRKHYLDFQQATFSSFRFEEVANAYLNCFNVSTHAQKSVKTADLEHDALIELPIYAVLRMSTFMREGGFSEHAVAIWQGILEFNFCRPNRLQGSGEVQNVISTSELFSAFGEFWDSEVPRIGEVDAAGWAAFDSEGTETLASNKDTQSLPVDANCIFESWAKQEHLQALQSRLPARTTDDVEENDPRRVILFSDIQDILIDVQSSSARCLLIQTFLIFCNLPLLPTEDCKAYCTSLYRDSFLRNETLYGFHSSLSSWKMQPSKHESNARKYGVGFSSGPFDDRVVNCVFGFCLVDYQVTSDTLFADPSTCFSALESWQCTYSSDQGPVSVPWIHRVLRTMADVEIDRIGLAELLLAFELRISPHTVRKTAKIFIKKQPGSLRLYNAYALIEYRLGKVANAEKALTAAINMSNTPRSSLKRGCDAAFLWRTLIWELLDSGQDREALTRLLTYTDREITVDLTASEAIEHKFLPESPSRSHTTQEGLSSARNQAMSEGLWEQTISYIELLILLTYLTDTDPLPSAISTFTANLGLLSTRLPSNSSFQELLHQSFARLLRYHVTHTALFKPSLIRSCLVESIALFPHNTIFLSLYMWNESSFRIDDRVRSIMKDVVLANNQQSKEDSVISHFFAIYTELNRGVALGSNTYAIRGTFERAVESKSGAHNAGLWKLYFVFEKDRGELQRAKAVFHRAMRACPWVKDIYMLAFDDLRDVMDERELREVYDMLGEKELRVHINLEDMLQRK